MWGSVLPSRVAYLIEAGSTDGFRTAVRAASGRWGGICELIIEVDPVSGVTAAAHDLVTRAELEAAVRVDVAGEFAVRACVGSALGWLTWLSGGGVIDMSDRSS